MDLVFVNESRAGLASVLSIWAPEGPQVEEGSLHLSGAARIRLDDAEATLEGSQFRLKTARGEGLWPLGPKPALRLAH